MLVILGESRNKCLWDLLSQSLHNKNTAMEQKSESTHHLYTNGTLIAERNSHAEHFQAAHALPTAGRVAMGLVRASHSMVFTLVLLGTCEYAKL